MCVCVWLCVCCWCWCWCCCCCCRCRCPCPCPCSCSSSSCCCCCCGCGCSCGRHRHRRRRRCRRCCCCIVYIGQTIFPKITHSIVIHCNRYIYIINAKNMSKGPKGEGKRELWFWLRTWCVISTGDPGGTNPSGFVGGTMGNLFYWTQGPLKIFNRFSSVIQTSLPGYSLILRGQTNRDLAYLLSTIGASIINICALLSFICFILSYGSFLWISHIYFFFYINLWLFLHVSHIFSTFTAGNPRTDCLRWLSSRIGRSSGQKKRSASSMTINWHLLLRRSERLPTWDNLGVRSPT